MRLTQHTEVTKRAGGYVAVLGAAVLWGLSGVVAKSLFAESVSPEILVAFRLGGGAACALLYATAFRRRALREAWSHRLRVALLGACLAATQFAYYAAIASSTVATAIFLQYLAPVLLVLWGRVAEGEPLTTGRLLMVGMAWCGAVLLVMGPHGLLVTPGAVGWGLVSAVLFATYTVLARREVARSDSWGVLALALAAGALGWTVVVLPWDAWGRPYTVTQWLRFAHLAVLATVVPFGLFLHGLRTVPPARAALVATVEPVVAAAAALAVLSEPFTARQATGAALILAAVAWTHWEGLREPLPRT